MPKLPQISGKKLIKVLEKNGFVVVRQKGSHVILERTDGPIVVVPVHGNKNLPKGTLAGILKDTEIAYEEIRKDW